ncbi:MAG: hypothetical protein ABI986_11425 [Chloroflexota bacterium]
MSKRIIAVSLLIIMISACTREITTPTPSAQAVPPVISNTQGVTPQAGTTPLATEAATQQSVPTSASAATAISDSVCPGAAAPHVAFGQLVTVVSDNTDKLKLRSEPKISADTVIRDLDTSTQLKILGGLVCVQAPDATTSYWFWMVQVVSTGETGWVAEGDSTHYFIELAQ